MIKDYYQKEIKIPSDYLKIGDQEDNVNKIQEWINLWKFFDSNWNTQIKQ